MQGKIEKGNDLLVFNIESFLNLQSQKTLIFEGLVTLKFLRSNISLKIPGNRNTKY